MSVVWLCVCVCVCVLGLGLGLEGGEGGVSEFLRALEHLNVADNYIG